MDDHGFFKFIWRFNAVVLAIMLVVLGVVAAWELGLRQIVRGHTVREVVNIDPQDTTLEETRSILTNEPVPGQQGLYRVSLVSEQDYASGYTFKGTQGSVLNTGFHDPVAGTTRWLFPGDDQLVTDVVPFYPPSQSFDHGAPRAVLGYLISFMDQDTSGDKRLSNSDRKHVMAVGPEGTGGKRILSDVIGDPQVWPQDGPSFVLFFNREDGLYSVIYDPTTMGLTTAHKLSQP